MNLRLCGRVLCLASLGLFLAACAKSGGRSVSVKVRPEDSYCSGTPVGGGTTVTSIARYQRYNDNATGLTTISLLPIRYAEAHILNAAGAIVNCNDTDNSGNVSITMPKVAGSYTLVVNSRASNAQLAASVLNSPSYNMQYQITASFTSDGTESSIPVTMAPASYTGTLQGGAFNILDRLLDANEYLRNNSTCTGCTTFTVAPKALIYWSPGVNPGNYLYPNASGMSFFLRSTVGNMAKGIYLLGGTNGSVCTDTDHFDDSVIVHEYGHFLEDSYSKSDSPGGSHNGNSVIDPRLAYSEGWAYYFQSMVLSRNFARDTVGNAGCGNAALAFPDFSTEDKFQSDTPTYTDEGNFREISVTRVLYDVTTGSGSDSDGRYADIPFARQWRAFTSLANTGYHFRNSGLLLETLNAFVPGGSMTAYNNVLAYEQQRKDELNYGLNLTPQSGATCTYQFTGGVPIPVTVSGAYLLRNNKFYEYFYDGTAAKSVVNLRYEPSTGTPYDLNVYAYVEDHTLGDAADIATSSARTYPEPGASVLPGFEQIDFTGRPAGAYLINVQAYYPGAARSDTIYYLELANGDRLCP